MNSHLFHCFVPARTNRLSSLSLAPPPPLRRKRGFTAFCHNPLCCHKLAIVMEKTRTVDVKCWSSGQTIHSADVAYKVAENVSHSSQCDETGPGVCPNCLHLDCSASFKDTVKGKDGLLTPLPYSSCTEPCANCQSKDHTVYNCALALSTTLQDRLKSFSDSTSAYTASQLAAIAYKYYKSHGFHSLISAEADSGFNLRAVVLQYVRLPMKRPHPAPKELLHHETAKHNLVALTSRVRTILRKLFASEVEALGGAKQNFTKGVNYLRELGEWFVERDRPGYGSAVPGKADWPKGLRSTFELVTKNRDEMADILVHEAELSYLRYGTWLFGTKENKARNLLVSSYDQSILNDITWSAKDNDVRFLRFGDKTRKTIPQSALDENAFEWEERKRRSADDQTTIAKRTFHASKSAIGSRAKLAAWVKSGKTAADYERSFAEPREEVGIWSVPASKLIASQIALHPPDTQYFYSFSFCHGQALRLLQNSPVCAGVSPLQIAPGTIANGRKRLLLGLYSERD